LTTNVPTPGIDAVSPALNVPVTPAIVNCVTVKVFPSASVSLDKTFPVAGIFCGVVAVSFEAIGASFTAVTTILNEPFTAFVPSDTV
jgi:hypothetical protein